MKSKFLLPFIAIVLMLVVAYQAFLYQNGCGFFIDVNDDLINGTDTDRFQYWNCYAAAGWADAEQNEFKVLNDKYGTPGNPGTHDFYDNEIGIWVSRGISSSPQHEITLSLYKNVITGQLRMVAELLWRYEELPLPGNPAIQMNVPMTEFDSIVQNWLPSWAETKLIEEAKKQNSEPIVLGEPYMELPASLVEYKKGYSSENQMDR